MGNPYEITLDEASLRWAAAEGVSEAVIAAIHLLHAERSVDDVVARLTTAELGQVVDIIGRSPNCYPPGAYGALKAKRDLASPSPEAGRPQPKPAAKEQAMPPPKMAVEGRARSPRNAAAPGRHADGPSGATGSQDEVVCMAGAATIK